mmetsp:Transcript_102639/g.203757  ORF Transcript_102639/g.203757 Transcript_102639/m.203757 type:complete len:95 (+) Transcript_102639:600-884(+)
MQSDGAAGGSAGSDGDSAPAVDAAADSDERPTTEHPAARFVAWRRLSEDRIPATSHFCLVDNPNPSGCLPAARHSSNVPWRTPRISDAVSPCPE